jgi:hypothetical protein
VFPGHGYPEMKGFLGAAFHAPRLRAMMPHLHGHQRVLRLATRHGPAYGECAPHVRSLSAGNYAVRTADGRELGVTDAAGAVALLLTELDARHPA